MTYFSRLTEIVACNVSQLLDSAEDRGAALQEILREMEDGVAGARRSFQTATLNEQRLQSEMDNYRTQLAFWTAKAREELTAGREDQARLALHRKKEVEDLTAGLQQQQASATALLEQLRTTLRALEARLAEARRIEFEQAEQQHDTQLSDSTAMDPLSKNAPLAADKQRDAQIEEELAALRRELGQ